MLNNIVLTILGICFISAIIFLCIEIYKCVRDIKKANKEIERAVIEVFKAFVVGDFCTLKSGQEIVLTDKFERDGKYYFEYKYFNEDAETIGDVTSDEKFVVTIKQFSQLIK